MSPSIKEILEQQKEAPKKLAIACQGGGALTAYQAGMLAALVLESYVKNATGEVFIKLPFSLDGSAKEDGSVEETVYQLVGISGTSGGAQNAAITWWNCINGNVPEVDLKSWWDNISAHLMDLSPSGFMAHYAILSLLGWQKLFGVRFEPTENIYANKLRNTFIASLRGGLSHIFVQDDVLNTQLPLFIGAAEVRSGAFTNFLVGDKVKRNPWSEKYDDYGIMPCDNLCPEHLMASACLPDLFGAQPYPLSKLAKQRLMTQKSIREAEINGASHNDWGCISPETGEGFYWDGLFSENPAITPFLRYRNELKPDEILILRINPASTPELQNETEKQTDRYNELVDNISLEQEIVQIKFINSLLSGNKCIKDCLLQDGYKNIAVRQIDIPWVEQRKLRVDDKYKRFPSIITERVSIGKNFILDMAKLAPVYRNTILQNLA